MGKYYAHLGPPMATCTSLQVIHSDSTPTLLTSKPVVKGYLGNVSQEPGSMTGTQCMQRREKTIKMCPENTQLPIFRNKYKEDQLDSVKSKKNGLWFQKHSITLIATQVNVCHFASPNDSTSLFMFRPRFPGL